MTGPEIPLRCFIDGKEVSVEEALAAEEAGTAMVVQGGSGVVPEKLRQLGETEDQWLRPWLQMRSI